MRAAVINATKSFDIVQVPDPTPRGDDLVLRVHACGICGSDLKAVHNLPGGLVMGHEFCGEVVALGRGAEDRWKVGDRVAAMPLIGCGACLTCLSGDVAHCERGPDMIGVGGSSGGYAEYVRVGAREAFALPASFEPGLGALVEPLAVGLHAVDRATICRGESVLIIGAGPVGLACAMWARHVGAQHVVVSDPIEHRRATAMQLGATATIDPGAGPVADQLRSLVGDKGVDVVLECVGVPGMVQASIDATKVHGRVVIVGVCTQPDPFVPITALMRELTLHFVVYYRMADFAYTIAMIDAGRIDPAAFVTDRISLDQFPAAFEALKHPSTQAKVLVIP
jgi:(R,R)-butanediol dehydrogenase/meso-butanediol dehydrogenase/diacetyl reductase